MAVVRTPFRQPVVVEHFPFGVEFQKSLLRLLCEDVGFANALLPYLQPGYFENEVLVWAFGRIQKHREVYNAVPALKVILEETRDVALESREFYRNTIEAVMAADLSAEDWLRDKVLDFVKRNLFVVAFKDSREQYNMGKVTEAYETMAQAMDRIHNTDWNPPDRSFFFEEFEQRVAERLSVDPTMDSVPTGIHELDHVLGGGLSKGELGIWTAYSKRGKSTMLVNLGVQAVRRSEETVIHFVFEGSRKQVETRYDTVFAREEYYNVKTGTQSDDAYRRMMYDYRMYRRRLVVRGFTSEWNYSCADIWNEMRELKRLHGWEPGMLIVDYGDLLRSREKFHRTETEHQTAAFKDLKSLANRGYRVWTASQAQRPKIDIDMSDEVLQSRRIADAWAKVKVADFLGTINQTLEERQQKVARLFAEMYRDNSASKLILVRADFSQMTIESIRSAGAAVVPTAAVASTPLGYTVPQQRKAPV